MLGVSIVMRIIPEKMDSWVYPEKTPPYADLYQQYTCRKAIFMGFHGDMFNFQLYHQSLWIRVMLPQKNAKYLRRTASNQSHARWSNLSLVWLTKTKTTSFNHFSQWLASLVTSWLNHVHHAHLYLKNCLQFWTWLWVKIKDLGDHRLNLSLFSVSIIQFLACPILTHKIPWNLSASHQLS